MVSTEHYCYLHMSIKKSHRPCPVCSTREVEVIHHQRFILPAGHPLPASFDVVACPTCGMTYADTAGTASDYDKYYADYSKYADQATSTGGGGNQHDQARLAETATEIAKHIPNRSLKIVDIGCANGGLLGALKERGYSHLFGVDPSPACVENTKKQFGIPASQGWLLALPEEAKSADLAIVSHVFEHVLDLRDALARMHESLSAEGVIYVEVPDAQRYVDCLTSPFQDFNTEHINHFDAASLENLFEAAGFDSLTIGTKTLQAAAGVPYPALFGFFRKRKNALQSALHQWKRNPAFRKSMDIYIAKSRAELAAIDGRLQLATSGPVIVWGTGQLTLKLLAETSLGRTSIAAFTDGNPINHGKCLCDIEIIAPERLCALPPYPIIIGTLLHHLEITKRIRALGLDNPIVTLN